MNPAKMRNTYGKLMYLIMDTESYNIKSDLKVSFLKPIRTVHRFLEKRNGLSLLRDPLLASATISISNESNEKSKSELYELQTRKQQAIEMIIKKYSSGSF